MSGKAFLHHVFLLFFTEAHRTARRFCRLCFSSLRPLRSQRENSESPAELAEIAEQIKFSVPRQNLWVNSHRLFRLTDRRLVARSRIFDRIDRINRIADHGI